MASEDRRNSPDRTIAFEGRYPLVAAFGACYVDKAKQSLCQSRPGKREPWEIQIYYRGDDIEYAHGSILLGVYLPSYQDRDPVTMYYYSQMRCA